jgi:hypothetical protein
VLSPSHNATHHNQQLVLGPVRESDKRTAPPLDRRPGDRLERLIAEGREEVGVQLGSIRAQG